MAYRPVSSVSVKPWKLLATTAIPASIVPLYYFREMSGESILSSFNADWIVGLIAAHTALSIKVVPAGYRAGIFVLEQNAMEVGPGIYYVPKGLARIDMFPIAAINMQFPAEPEDISKLPDTSPLGEKHKLPIRITSGPPKEGVTDILNERLSPEFLFSVVWEMGEGEFFELYTKIPGHTWADKLREVRILMRDEAEGLLTYEISVLAPTEINAQIRSLAERLKAKLQEAVADWGILVRDVRLQSPDYGTGIAHALAEVPEARAKARVRGIQAEAQRDASITEAEGSAQARERIALADQAERAAKGKGDAEAAESLGMTGAEYVTLEKGTQALGDKTVILGLENITGPVAVGKTIIDALSKKASTKD